jgi:hypothetical protein
MSTYYDPTINLDAYAQSEENKLVNLALTKLPQPHITGLKLRQDIQLGSLVLNRIDPNTGIVWVLTGLEGWWTLPDSEFPDLPRGWGDGSYDSDGRYTARVLTLEGSILTQNPEQSAEARAQLVNAINLVYRGASLIVNEPIRNLRVSAINASNETITVAAAHRLAVGDTVIYRTTSNFIPGLVSDVLHYVASTPTATTLTLSRTRGGSAVNITTSTLPAGVTHTLEVVQPKTSFVRISGKPQIRSANARGRLDFSIGLKAADPIKYEYYANPSTLDYRSVALTRNSSVVVTNTGDTRVPVIFRVQGPILSSATATIANETVSKSITGIYAPPSGLLEIDTYNRNILEVDTTTFLGTVGRRYANSYIDWFYLEPGANSLKFSSTVSTATCTMLYKSGWIS